MTGEWVVLVHGLWLDGSEFKWMETRLRRYGYRIVKFQYPSVKKGLEENAQNLWAFMELRFGPGMGHVSARSVHLVCHSLGGMVALRMLEIYPQAPIGRVMALGTPFQGSFSAQRLATWPGGASLLGKSMLNAMDGSRKVRVPEGREVGVLAGTLPLGWSSLIWEMEKPNDGVITVAETHLPGALHATLPLMHVGLVFSRRAARMVRCFLATGELR